MGMMVCYYGVYMTRSGGVPYCYQDNGFTRKPSLIKTDCISWKNFLGLTRQRSEINLSDLGLLHGEQRRSRSEVRGVSCDRLSVGYHHSPNICPPPPALINTKTRSSSPVNKSGCWLRGRKRERESRSSSNNRIEIAGKTIVTESTRKSSKSSEVRTIADQTNVTSNKADKKSTKDQRYAKLGKKNGAEKVIEEVIYAEIGFTPVEKLQNSKRESSKGASKKNRKKGLAPQIPLRDVNGDVNLNPNGTITSRPNCFDEKPRSSPCIKPPRKPQTNTKSSENIRISNKTSSVKGSKLLNSPKGESTKNKVVAVAEIHKNRSSDKKESTDSVNTDVKQIYSKVSSESNRNKENKISKEQIRAAKNAIESDTSNNNIEKDAQTDEEKESAQEEKIEIPPYHIDTPDYSTLDSENDPNGINQDPNRNESRVSLSDSITADSIDEDFKAVSDSNATSSSEIDNSNSEICYSSILRDSATDVRCFDNESSPKKVVRFEKFDLIDKYKKNKSDCAKITDEDSDTSSSKYQPVSKKILDFNCNEITTPETELLAKQSLKYFDSDGVDKTTSSSECPSECSLYSSPTQKECPHNGMTVNVVVRNPSPELTNCMVDSQTDDAHAQLVVKKSFVLTIAKQEKGFKSLFANKKPDVINVDQSKDHKISVTFLCSNGAPPDACTIGNPIVNALRLRSLSVPPQNLPELEPPPLPPPMRGRSRERRSKERIHCKKTHKSRKKETAFHMPQAVIDELSQVLEKRKPSPDGILAT
nr:titin homolog isoform X2 [Parasteatoda tepidariorum]